MRYVVTGAAGFIGSTLCDALLAGGHEVTGVDSYTDYYPRPLKEANLSRARDHANFELLEIDLADAELNAVMGDTDGVFHLAAQPGVRESWGAEFATYVRDSILATQRVLEACRCTGAPRIVYASSSSVYGNAATLPAVESAVPHPISPYGISKHASEQLCAAYYEGYGIPVVMLRYFTVYGPRQRPDMAFHRFIKNALIDQPISRYGDGSQSRDFTFVEDAVAGTSAAMSRGLPGRIYNLGGGAVWTLNQILDAIQRVTGCRVRIQSADQQLGDVQHTQADITRARAELGFEPRTDVNSGLSRQAEWTRELLAAGLLKGTAIT
jgi:nucleoside-diphosphate-sugar epimerase